MPNDLLPKANRNTTIVDIARESGVSYSTVSRVLNGYEFVKDSTRQKVLETAERMGYVANLSARSLAGGRSNIIALLVPGLDNGYIGEIARGIDEELARSNYELMLYTTHRHSGKEEAYVSAVANGLSDGVLLIVPLISGQYLEVLRAQGFPYVLIDQSDPTGHSSVVDATNWQGAYDATEHLIEQGHRRIALITGHMGLASAVDRLEGYKAALLDHHLPVDESLIIAGDYWHSSGVQAGHIIASMPNRPTALFASNDLMALGIMDALREHSINIPEDISLVGFDDIPQASITHPKLTTVRQPLDQMGRVAARLLLEQIDHPDRPSRRVTLATRLVIRGTTQPPVSGQK